MLYPALKGLGAEGGTAKRTIGLSCRVTNGGVATSWDLRTEADSGMLNTPKTRPLSESEPMSRL
jgi:hypothetical protein